MIASLPMYDRPEAQAANDRLWAFIAEALDAAPQQLDRALPLHEVWTRPDLVLSQTCGLPFMRGLHSRTHLVASPDFRLDGCPPGYYRSAIAVHKDEPRDLDTLLATDAIVNGRDSQSGYNALYQYAQSRGVTLANPVESGAHYASAKAIAEGKAGIAAIDANTLRMIARWDGWVDQLRIVDWTRPTPAMPYICGPGADPAAIRRALLDAIDAIGAENRALLGLYGLADIPKSAYLAVPPPPL